MFVVEHTAWRKRSFFALWGGLAAGFILSMFFLVSLIPTGSAAGWGLTEPSPTATPAGFPVPFHPDSIWNRPIAADVAVHPSSDHWMQLLLSEWSDPNAVPLEIDGIEWAWSVPIYEADESTPRYRVCADDYATHCSDDVPIPEGLIVSPDSDAKVVVVDRSADPPRAWSFWRLFEAGGEVGYTAGYGAYGWTPIDATGDGIVNYDGGEWGGRATSWNYYGGLIHPEEIAQGVIDHALVIIVPGQVVGSEAVWPARAGDGYSEDPNPIPLGVRFQLDPTIDVNSLGLSRGGTIVARALQVYGAWLGDTGSLIALNAREYLYRDEYGGVRVDPTPWEGLLGAGDLQQFPTERLRVVEVDPDEFYRLPLPTENGGG